MASCGLFMTVGVDGDDDDDGDDGDDGDDACGGGSHDPVEWRRNLCTWLLLLLWINCNTSSKQIDTQMYFQMK